MGEGFEVWEDGYEVGGGEYGTRILRWMAVVGSMGGMV